MKTINLKKLSFRIYTEANEVPIENLLLMHKYSLYASGIGHGKDIGVRFQRLLAYLNKEDIRNATEETNNLMAAYYLSLEGIDPGSVALCCLIHSIDGVVLNDYSQDNLMLVLKRLSKAGISQVELSEILGEVKKNFNRQLAVKFPKWFNNWDEEHYFNQVLDWIQINCDNLLGNEVNKNRLDSIEQYFYDLNLPKNFDDEDPLSAVNQHDKNFEKVCAQLQKYIPNEIEKLNVVKFYSLLESFEKKNKH